MKTSHLFSVTVSILTVLAMPFNAQCQFYHYVNPIQQLEIGVANGTNVGNNLLTLAGGSVSRDVTIDPGALTIRQQGTISVPAGSAQFFIHETQNVPGQFPNPPTTAIGDMTVTLSYAGGTAAFDTGTRNLSWNGQAYAFNGNASFGLPMNVSYSLVTGGQTYTGSVLHTVGFTFNGGSEIDTSGYPASIVLVPDAGVGLNLFQSLGANATAANGFRMELVAVPEPSTIALGVLSVVGCFCFRRARKTGTGR